MVGAFAVLFSLLLVAPAESQKDGGRPASANEAPTMPTLSGDALSPGTLNYRQTLEIGDRMIDGKLVRKIAPEQLAGRSTWKVTDTLTTEMGTAQDELWIDPRTLLPIKRQAKQGPASIDILVGAGLITGQKNMGSQPTPIKTPIDGPMLLDGGSLEIALSGLPLRPGYRAKLRSFNTTTGLTQSWTAEVRAAESVKIKESLIETYKVTLTTAEDRSGATMWIEAGGSHRLIKMEAMFGAPGRMGKLTRILDG